MTQGTLAAEYVAKAAAASSAGIAGFTWIAQVNDIMQFVATGVAIIAGIYAIVWHRVRIADMKRKTDKIHKEVTGGKSDRSDS